ncbi:MAG: hypothetical protein ABIQ17_06475 [Candidatus Limnocylindrales bacterium]
MIVICGSLEQAGRHETLATAVATRAVALEAVAQVVGIVPEGADGDSTLLALSEAGVGHAAVLRAASRPLERADLDLALRYLPDARVVVAVDLDAELLPALADGAAFAGAPLVVVTAHGAAAGVGRLTLPDSAIVLQAPVSDSDGTFAGFVAAFASRLDAGDAAADAWMSTLQSLAVDPISGSVGRPVPAADR